LIKKKYCFKREKKPKLRVSKQELAFKATEISFAPVSPIEFSSINRIFRFSFFLKKKQRFLLKDRFFKDELNFKASQMCLVPTTLKLIFSFDEIQSKKLFKWSIESNRRWCQSKSCLFSKVLINSSTLHLLKYICLEKNWDKLGIPIKSKKKSRTEANFFQSYVFFNQICQ